MKPNEQHTPPANTRLEKAQQKLARFEGVSDDDTAERLDDLRERLEDIARNQPNNRNKFIRQMWVSVLCGFVKVSFNYVWDYLVEMVENVPD